MKPRIIIDQNIHGPTLQLMCCPVHSPLAYSDSEFLHFIYPISITRKNSLMSLTLIPILPLEKRARKRAEEREREARGGSEGVKLLWSERDVSPALTTSTRVDGSSSAHARDTYSVQSTLKMDPRLKEMLNTCASYNIDQGDDDDPLSEAVVEELRHADKMDIINERSLVASPMNSPSRSHNRTLLGKTKSYFNQN